MQARSLSVESTPSTRTRKPISDSFLFLTYNAVGIPVLFFAFHLLGIFNTKIRNGIKGRRTVWEPLTQVATTWSEHLPRIWLHASSMGELEQARPVIKALRERTREVVIVVTVFSPSVRINVSRVPGADVVSYLPFDSLFQARRFVRLVRPDALVVVRHDIWPNHLREASRWGSVVTLINASLTRPSVIRNRLVRALNRAALSCFDHIFAIGASAAAELQALVRQPERVKVVGETRYDQVRARSMERRPETGLVQGVLADRWTLVAGSTWPSDEEPLIEAFVPLHREHGAVAMVLVPHEPTSAHVRMLAQRLDAVGLKWRTLSALESGKRGEVDVILVDKIGVLGNLYAAARVAYVGGGLGPGVHSVLEPAAHGVPVFFGNRMQNSPEAVAMLEDGFAMRVESAEDIHAAVRSYIRDEELRQDHGFRARRFVEMRLGASDEIARFLLETVDSR